MRTFKGLPKSCCVQRHCREIEQTKIPTGLYSLSYVRSRLHLLHPGGSILLRSTADKRSFPEILEHLLRRFARADVYAHRASFVPLHFRMFGVNDAGYPKISIESGASEVNG